MEVSETQPPPASNTAENQRVAEIDVNPMSKASTSYGRTPHVSKSETQNISDGDKSSSSMQTLREVERSDMDTSGAAVESPDIQLSRAVESADTQTSNAVESLNILASRAAENPDIQTSRAVINPIIQTSREVESADAQTSRTEDNSDIQRPGTVEMPASQVARILTLPSRHIPTNSDTPDSAPRRANHRVFPQGLTRPEGEQFRGSERRHLGNSPACFRDTKKMTVAASLCTMVYSVLCIGFLVNDLMDVSTEIETYERMLNPRYRRDHDYQETINRTETKQHVDIGDRLHELTVTKIMYTILICDLVLLLISSVAMMKGLFQRKQTLICVWILIVVFTMVYGGALITRDIHLHLTESETRQLSGAISARLGFFAFFVVMEAGFMRYVVRSFRDVRRSATDRRLNTAVFDPRNPGHSLFTISGDMEPQSPETLFKLPSYDEVTAETPDGPSSPNKTGTSEVDPPPYEPPAYAP